MRLRRRHEGARRRWRIKGRWARFAVAARLVGGARHRRRRAGGTAFVLPLPPLRGQPRRVRWYEVHAGGVHVHTEGGDRHDEEEKAYLRVGEAKNPGPGDAKEARRTSWGAFSAQHPHCGGFRHASAPGFSPEPEGADCDEPKDDMGYYALRVLTANCTSWGSLVPLLARTEADVMLVQELRIGPEQADAKVAWLRRRGWNAIISPAVLGPNGGWSAGVAVIARQHIGLSLPMVGSEIVVAARVIAARIEAPGCRPCLAISCYLHDGVGLGRDNLEVLRQLGAFITAHGDDCPFIIGGDLQVTPQEMASTGFAGQCSAVVAASCDPAGTCRTARTAREIDFFMVSRGLSAGIERVSTVPRTGLKTHTPVMLTFKPRLTSIRALVIRQPPRMKTERIVGPLRQVADWRGIAERAKALADDAADEANDIEDLHERLGNIYTEWADLAEEELIECTVDGQLMPKRGTRGRAPVMVWRSVLPERRKQDDGNDYAIAWRSVANTALGLQRLAAEASPTHADPGVSGPSGADRFFDGDDVFDDVGDATEGNVLDDQADQCRDWELQLRDARDDAGELLNDLRRLHRDGKIDDDAFNIDEAMAIELIDLLRRLAETRSAGAGDLAEIRKLRERVGERADDIAEAMRRQHEHEWIAWLREGIDKGAKNAHRYLRLPAQWRPQPMADADGILSSDPAKLVEAYRTKYLGRWNGQAGGEAEAAPRPTAPWYHAQRTALPRPTVSELREASRAFSEDTAVAFDGFSMRHFAMLSDNGLETLADIIITMELIGRPPATTSFGDAAHRQRKGGSPRHYHGPEHLPPMGPTASWALPAVGGGARQTLLRGGQR